MTLRGWIASLVALSIPAVISASNAPAPPWRLTRSENFEIYAQASDQHARAMLNWFEQLRAFFQQQSGWKTSPRPVRIIAFASQQEYQSYRLRSTADAYYIGTESQDYIVLATSHPDQFRLAAHEYAHLVLRASGQQLPPWLQEGLAEVFSTLRFGGHGTELGGALPGRVSALQRQTWMPLAELMSLSEDSHRRQERSAADLFYAESWALTEMLLLSPKYASDFEKILASPNLDAETVTRDLHKWMDRPKLPVVQLPDVMTQPVHVEVSDVAPLTSRLVLAQLLLAAGDFDSAEARFSALAQQAPDSADVSAGLGAIALHKGDSAGARSAWKRAIQQGVTDAKLCYQYAILADQAGLPADDIRPALERAVTLQPDFDDARYQLALLDKNSGRYETALREFQAMGSVPDMRAYAYWLAIADTFNELGRRDEAQSAARSATEHATTAAERASADQERYMAQTDPGVQFARDADGHLQLVTTRVPHQTTDWNPFIEPGDDIHRVQGRLREIDCGDVTTIGVEAAGKMVTLTIADLRHVQMRHAPPEFVCGPQNPTAPVIVDYTATGHLVRGMDFSAASVSPAGAP